LLYEAIVADKWPVHRVVVASSQFVYGEGRYECERCGIVFPNNRTRQSLDGGHWDPACPTCDGTIAPLPLLELHANPQNQYSISKFTQELTAICLGRNYGIPSTALRYSIVHGPFQSYRNAYSGALRVFTLELLKGKRPPIFEDGLQLRDYVNVSDVAAANVLALESEELVGQVVNVGGGKGYTVLELAALIADELSVEMQIEPHGEYRVGDTRHSVSDISKLNRVGWRPTKTLRNNVKEYVEWIRNQEMDRDYVSEALALLRTSGALRSISSGSS
jgi:dTDP-L-rhamnose 4-epimerase